MVHLASASREGFLYIDLLPPKGTAFSGISGALNRYFKEQGRQGRASPAMPAGRRGWLTLPPVPCTSPARQG